MSKNVHIAFPIDDEDESGKKVIDKALEVLGKLKTVCQTPVMEITLIAHCTCRWITRTNALSGALSYFWPGPSCNSIAPQVKGKMMRMRMDRVRST